MTGNVRAGLVLVVGSLRPAWPGGRGDLFNKAPERHLKNPALIAQLGFVGDTPEIPEAGTRC